MRVSLRTPIGDTCKAAQTKPLAELARLQQYTRTRFLKDSYPRFVILQIVRHNIKLMFG